MIRTIAIGKNIHLNDVLDMEHTLEVQLQSKNLFDVSKVATDSTITNEGNRTLTAHKWEVASSTTLRTVCPELKAGDVATFSFETTSEADYIGLYDSGITWTNKTSLEITEERLDSKIVFYCNEVDGEETDALISNIQIELGRKTTDYSPYITDFTDREVAVSGKNLIPFPYPFVSGATPKDSGITATYTDDGVIRLNGTSIVAEVQDLHLYTFTNLPAGTYTLSGCPGVGGTYTYNLFCMLTKADGSVSYPSDRGSGSTFTIQEGDTVSISIRFGKDLGTVENLTFYPQLELGATATAYNKPTYTYVADADGTVQDVKSYSPIMNLTQESNDIIIKCSYIPQSMRELPIASKLEGINSGIAQVYNKGITDGKQAEHERFWSVYLNPKGWTSLAYRFAGNGWDDQTFCPPVGTVITSANCISKSANQMFQSSFITDLKGICEDRNITLDFSKTESFSQTFCDCRITAVPTINTRSAKSINNLFWNPSDLVTVEKLILKDEGSQTCDRTFHLVKSLQNIVIEGKFGNSVDVSAASSLSKLSIEYFVNALLDSADRKTLTLSRTAVNKAFETVEGANDGETSYAWKTLKATKLNWTISLL